jgi:hypothetical protein
MMACITCRLPLENTPEIQPEQQYFVAAAVVEA